MSEAGGLHSSWVRPAVSLVGLVVVYYAIPERITASLSFGLSVLIMAAGVLALAWAISGQVRRHLAGEDDDLKSLVMLLMLVVVVFAYGFYGLEQARPGEVSSLDTRTDALYFTMSTMSTVGYGDVHAEGQTARALVTVQLAFNVVFVGALASVLTRRVRSRAQRGREDGRTRD